MPHTHWKERDFNFYLILRKELLETVCKKLRLAYIEGGHLWFRCFEACRDFDENSLERRQKMTIDSLTMND